MKDPDKHFFDDPHNVKLTLRVLYGICVGLLLLDFVYHRHVIHAWEGIFGFYALFGFVACVALVLGAKEMRKILRRDEEYYEER
jgi:hypothetical protein